MEAPWAPRVPVVRLVVRRTHISLSQSNAPVEFSPERVCQVVEASLGRPLSEVFESFDTTPVGSATIGQVVSVRACARVGVACARVGGDDLLYHPLPPANSVAIANRFAPFMRLDRSGGGASPLSLSLCVV